MTERKNKTSPAQLRAIKKWQETHPEEWKAYQRSWRENHPDECRKYQKDALKKNLKWQIENRYIKYHEEEMERLGSLCEFCFHTKETLGCSCGCHTTALATIPPG